MVGNKAQKAVAAALTGVLAFGGIAPAFAGVWTGDEGASWYRINGDHSVTYELGTLNDDDELSASGYAKTAVSGTKAVKGQNRYDTAWDAINYNSSLYVPGGKGTGTKYIVLASGTSQADALVASGVAGMLKDQLIDDVIDGKWNGAIHVPVMITPADELCQQAENAITWLAENSAATKAKDFKVYLVGGTAALSEAVEDAVADIEVQLADDTEKKEISVERVWGEDRVATSLEAAKVVDADTWLDEDKLDDNNQVYVANGVAWPDALSVSSFAYSKGEPILLTGADGKLSEDQLDYLKQFDESVTIEVIGGPAQPSAQQLWDAGFKQATVNYRAGVNRYETSAMVIKARYVGEYTTIAVASGAEGHWADALIGGPFVGANGGVLALVDGVDEVTALKQAYKQVKKDEGKKEKETAEAAPASFVIGGEAAIDKKFADKLNDNFPVWTI